MLKVQVTISVVGEATDLNSPSHMEETRKFRKSKKNNYQTNTHSRKKAAITWRTLKTFFSWKNPNEAEEKKEKKGVKFGCSVSLCNTRESSRVMHGAQISCNGDLNKVVSGDGISGSRRLMKMSWNEMDGTLSSSFTSSRSATTITSASSLSSLSSSSSSTSSLGGSFRRNHTRRLSGCYECHSAVNPIPGASSDPSSRYNIFTCNECGEMFLRSDRLDLHQSICHAVSELGPEDTSRNIVEIIFQSSWIKKQSTPCKIERILKINNTQKTITKFEDYRNFIQSRASNQIRKNPRCVTDGNELLRFYSTNFTCSIGFNGSTSLCHCIPQCNLCSIIRNGFKLDSRGRIPTMGTSKTAHDSVGILEDHYGEKRAMMVSRVIAGRVMKKSNNTEEHDAEEEEHDSVAAGADELCVFNPKALLPCFLVIYSSFWPLKNY